MPNFRMTSVAACLLSLTLFAAGCAEPAEGEAKKDTAAAGTDESNETAGSETGDSGTDAATEGTDVRSKVIGTWREIDGNPNATMTFAEDGTAQFLIAEPGVEETIERNFKWTILDDGRLQLEMSRGGETMTQVSEVKFEGDDILVTTDEKGKVERNERVKSEPAPEGGADPAE